MNKLTQQFFRYTLLFTIVLSGACVPKAAWAPVNVGREYGNGNIPIMESHLPKANQWAMARTGHHYSLRQILCFDYKCRKMIGRRKAMKAISFDDFKKRVHKNAKKGVYDKPATTTPKVKPTKPVKVDSVVVIKDKKDTVIAAAAPLPVLKADSLITFSDFLFETNSSKLKQKHFASMDSLARFLVLHPTLNVMITGHTDNTGAEHHNVALSTRRAEVVAEYLSSQGVDFDQISFEGFGSSKPIAPNTSPEGRGKNRRVEIILHDPNR